MEPIFGVDLRTVFSPANVAQDIMNMTALPASILDTYYPVEVRQPWPFAQIGVDEINKAIGTIPVVKRGGQAVSIDGDSGQIIYIEPQGIDAKINVLATELNNVKTLLQMGAQNGIDPVAIWRQAKEDTLRRTCRLTTDALAAQSLTGSISYPMLLDGGAIGTYEVVFGSIQTYTPDTSWDTAQLTLAKIILDLVAIVAKLQAKGYGSNIRWEVGSTVFSTLAAIIGALPNDSRVQASFNDKGVTVGGFTLNLVAGGYQDPATKATTPYLGANDIRAIDMNAPRKLWYLALDDVNAGLQALPFFVNAEPLDEGRGWKLIGRSKPLPVPTVNAICKATVIF